MNARLSRPFDRIICLGLILLAVANTVTFILTRHTSLSEHVVDPFTGFLQGAAIGTLLLGIYRQARSGRRDHRCAASTR